MAKTKFEIIRESAKKTPAPWKFDAQAFAVWNKKEIYTDSPRTESGSFYRAELQYTESWNISGQIPTIRVYRYTPCNPGEENTMYTLVQIYKQTVGETQKQRNFNYLLKLAPTLDIDALFKRAIEEDTGKAYNDLSDFWATPENAPENPEETAPEEIPTAEATTPDRAAETAPEEIPTAEATTPDRAAETAESTSAPALFKYGMNRRGFSIGTQPREGFTERQDDPTGLFYDIIIYNRELTPQELSDYELTPIIDTTPDAEPTPEADAPEAIQDANTGNPADATIAPETGTETAPAHIDETITAEPVTEDASPAEDTAPTLDGETVAKYDEIKDSTGTGILWEIIAHHEIRRNEKGFFIVYNIDYFAAACSGYRNPYYYADFAAAEKDLYTKHGGSFNQWHKLKQTYKKPGESPEQAQTADTAPTPTGGRTDYHRRVTESHIYDIITYTRPLTVEEVASYELTPLTETPTATEAAGTPEAIETAAQDHETPTEATTEADRDNYYIENKETGKIELRFEKSYYMSLPDEKKKDIKSNFLFSRHSGAWISRRKFPNLYWPRKVAESLGLCNAGSEGERRTFAEQMEVKAAKAEHRAERMDARADKATAHGQSLQAPINRMHGDIAFFTQPNINTSAGRAFTRQRNRMWASWERGIEEFRKSDYYRERAEAARATASQTKTTDKGFCQRRIDEANKTIRAQKKNIAHYEKQLARIESGETVTRWNGEEITAEEINKWLEDATDILIEAYGKVAYYDALIEAAGGILDKTSVKPGDIVKIRWKEPVKIISTKGNKNFTYEFTSAHMRYADGSQMRGQAAYAEIKEIVSAV